MLSRRTRWLVKATRRRWEGLIGRALIGLGIFVLSLGLALPLPIPGSNWVFLIPLFNLRRRAARARRRLDRGRPHRDAGRRGARLLLLDVVVNVLGRVWAWIT